MSFTWRTPRRSRSTKGLSTGGDEADAAYLAKLLATGATSGGLHLSTRSTRRRDLCRKRMQLVQYRTAQVLSIENILAAQIGTRAHQHESATELPPFSC